MQKKSYPYFDLLEVKEVKVWPLGGQNGKLMTFLKSLTSLTHILMYMMLKRSNLNFDRSEVKDVKAGLPKVKTGNQCHF